MTHTDDFILEHKLKYVKSFLSDNALYDNCVSERRDIAKIDKLMTIKTLDGFWDKVRGFTKNVYSDHSIHRWQCLAEMRQLQLDLQQNYADYINQLWVQELANGGI